MKATPIDPKHQDFLDEHFSIEPQWKQFHRKLRSKQFANAVLQDPRTDKKLQQFTRMVGLRQQSRSSGVPVIGDTGNTYKVKYHPEAKRFSCSCPDWTYKRSVRHRGKVADCKHIKRLKEVGGMKKTALFDIPLRLMAVNRKAEKDKEKAQKFQIREQAYRRYFHRPGLVNTFLKEAALRGQAARRLLAG